MEKILEVVIFIGLGMIVFGVDQFFTVKYGEKWYPGLSVGFWKVSDETSKILIKLGFFVTIISFIIVAILY